MKSVFKVGDQVVCIDDSGQAKGMLDIDRVYTIAQIIGDMVRVPIESRFSASAKWFTKRFELASIPYDPSQMGDRDDDV